MSNVDLQNDLFENNSMQLPSQFCLNESSFPYSLWPLLIIHTFSKRKSGN